MKPRCRASMRPAPSTTCYAGRGWQERPSPQTSLASCRTLDPQLNWTTHCLTMLRSSI
uniref:Uncharacterized protein n=1 Tax=Arundo donax TaxID=35708 RepID=A0A0A9FLX3_ARUDO